MGNHRSELLFWVRSIILEGIAEHRLFARNWAGRGRTSYASCIRCVTIQQQYSNEIGREYGAMRLSLQLIMFAAQWVIFGYAKMKSDELGVILVSVR